MSPDDRHKPRGLKEPAVELAGRSAEFARLEAFASGSERSVLHLHGIPGIGKTLLINALSETIAASGVRVVRIDARWCEPSPPALCRAISSKLALPETAEPASVAAVLSAAGKRTLLVIDSYESYRLLDSWLRQAFLPSLGDGVRTILS